MQSRKSKIKELTRNCLLIFSRACGKASSSLFSYSYKTI